jgi:isoamylase
MGDELSRTQRGNNNAYCQDNEISWLDWGLLHKNGDIFRFAKLLIHARLLRDLSKPEFSMTLNTLLKSSEIRWHGIRLNQPDWSDHSHSIAFTVNSLSGQLESHYMINAFNETLSFELPVPDTGRQWRRWIDTSLPSPDDISYWNQAPIVETQEYRVAAYSIVVLIGLTK